METLILWVILLGILGWMAFNYFRVKKAAKIVENQEFADLIRTGQLVDIREASEFQSKHILGARNIPASQLKTSLVALRKDKPVLLYENSRAQRVMNAALMLQKAGYKDIYILSYGLDGWDGKVKKAK